MAGVDILRTPIDEAIAIVYVFLLRNLDEEDRNEMIADLDRPLPQSEEDPRTQEEAEDDDLLAYLGIPGLRRNRPTPALDPGPVVE